MTNLETLLSKLQKVKQDKTDHWMAACPAHKDDKASLSISLKNNRILMNCHAGCDTTSVLRHIDASYKDLFLDDKPDLILVDRYRYTDELDNVLFFTLRYLPKTFKQCHPGPNGETVWNLEGVRRVLYHLRDILFAVCDGDTIFITEGEKDANNVWNRIMRPATCNPMGAGKWRDEYTETLKGAADIVIIPDNDQAGYNHARAVAQALYGLVTRLRILIIPAPYKDFSDWMESIPKWDNNGRLDYDNEAIPQEFEKLMQTASEYTPEYKFPGAKISLQTCGGIPI